MVGVKTFFTTFPFAMDEMFKVFVDRPQGCGIHKTLSWSTTKRVKSDDKKENGDL